MLSSIELIRFRIVKPVPKNYATGTYLNAYACESIDIRTEGGFRTPFQKFRCHESRGPTRTRPHRAVTGAVQSTQPEISQLRIAVAVN